MSFDHVDQLMQRLIDEGHPGCTLHVTQHGKLIYEGCYGFSDAAKEKKITPYSVFRMASMSKLPLYTTMMILYERALIRMSDPLYKYLPEWKTSRKVVYDATGHAKAVETDRPILIRDIMTMACGLPYANPGMKDSADWSERSIYEAMAPLYEKGYFTNREEVAAMSKALLAFEPGTHWMYGFSSELAAAVIEAVCDKPCNEVFKELLFDPLGMDSTSPHFKGDLKERMVDIFAEKPDGTFEPTYCGMDEKHNPGEKNMLGNPRLLSTGRDYSRLMAMLACGGTLDGVRVMGRKTIDLMRSNTLTPQQLKDFPDKGYGYGYGVRTLIDKAAGDNNGSLGSFGWTGGFGTWCEADPEDEVSIVYMENLFPALNMDYTHGLVRTAAYGAIE